VIPLLHTAISECFRGAARDKALYKSMFTLLYFIAGAVCFDKKLNAAELMRLYLDCDLITEAAELAIEYIRAALGAGKEYFGLKVLV